MAALEPDAPINLQNDPLVTSAYQVGLDWSDGAYNGGSPIIDYKILFREIGAQSFNVFSDTTAQQSETVTGLTPGRTYDFQV